jgi:hypothetical protein
MTPCFYVCIAYSSPPKVITIVDFEIFAPYYFILLQCVVRLNRNHQIFVISNERVGYRRGDEEKSSTSEQLTVQSVEDFSSPNTQFHRLFVRNDNGFYKKEIFPNRTPRCDNA